MDCIFCKIINNELPSFKIYEDEFVLAFLDINPAAEGHALVIPKKHFENIFGMEEIYLQRVIAVAQKIAEKMIDIGLAEGINLYQANGRVAEQVVPHFHLHVVPRNTNDKLNFTQKGLLPIDKLTNEEFETIKQKLNLG